MGWAGLGWEVLLETGSLLDSYLLPLFSGTNQFVRNNPQPPTLYTYAFCTLMPGHHVKLFTYCLLLTSRLPCTCTRVFLPAGHVRMSTTDMAIWHTPQHGTILAENKSDSFRRLRVWKEQVENITKLWRSVKVQLFFNFKVLSFNTKGRDIGNHSVHFP